MIENQNQDHGCHEIDLFSKGSIDSNDSSIALRSCGSSISKYMTIDGINNLPGDFTLMMNEQELAAPH